MNADEFSQIELLKLNIADLEKEKYHLIGRVKELNETIDELKRQNPPIVEK